MPVRNDIGNIGNAIAKGVKAEANIDYGPIRDAAYQAQSKVSVVNFTTVASRPNSFITGVHKWCDEKNLVTK